MPVFYKDSDGYYLGFNRAYEVFFGKSRNELIGKTAFEINPEAFAKAYHTKDLELFEKGGMQEYESQILNGKGNVRDVIFNKEVYRDRQGNIIGLIGTVLDITERKKSESEREKLQAKLMQSQKMESIGNLAGGIAHDFNNILSAVIGFTELALDEVEKGSTIENSLQEVHMAGKRAKDLVKQILTFARQSGEERHPIQPGLIAKEVLQFMRSTIPTTIEINHRIESGSFVMGNATQFHQVMMNLCTNAAHAMEDGGGTIEVSISDVPAHMVAGTDLSELPDQGYVEIRVSDTGVGIAPDTIDSIFEPYFTTKDPGEGTGMGLAVVQGIVESYGGQIRVKSELGEGSTFVIYMPTTRKSGQRSANEKQDLPTGDEQILFVDDEAPLARLGERMLSRLGYAVTTRTRSTEAMELFRSKPDDFDLVITDMAMPGMAGDQLAVALMNIRPDVPVILCTGYSKKMSKERALEIGIRAFANKPIVLADLAKAVRTVLDEAKLKTRG
jgi:PAS domain S-box-containing protein